MLGMNEVERAVVRSASNPLARGLIVTLHERFFDRAHQLRIAADLDGALFFLDDRQAAALFLLGMWSPSASAAVLGRREYLKLNNESYCTSSSSASVWSKSASVSPGKPTMMSVVMAMLRRACFIQSMRRMYSSRV